MRLLLKITLLVGLLMLTVLQNSFAHNPTASKTAIQWDSTNKKWYAHIAYEHNQMIAGLTNENPSLKIGIVNVNQWKEAFIQYLKKHISIEIKNEKINFTTDSVHLGTYFEAIFELENMPQTPAYIAIKNTCLFEVNPAQVNVVAVIKDKESFDVVLTPTEARQTIYLNKSIGNKIRSFYQFVIQGFKHVLPLGVDHILFIVALFLLNSNLKSNLIQASMFTLAHSITLILTGLGYINPNVNIVEPIIAFSIFIMALQNIFFRKLNHYRLGLVFLFGLIHGLGFANAFLSLQIPDQLALNALFAFNVGVELSQVFIILTLYYFFAKWVRNKSWYQKYFVIIVSALIGLFALLLTLQRF